LAAIAVIAVGAGAWFLTRGESASVAAVAPAPAVAQSPAAAAAISPPPPAPAPVQAREAAFTNRSASAPPMQEASAPAAAPIAGGLPADAPRIAISGGVYSPNPAQRMLIVNGQVFNEGSEVAPGVKIEAIQSRTATLGWRGARYTVAY
jgi:general secretion pathway protein B